MSDSPFIDGLVDGLKPSVSLGILDWLEQHARFPHSDRNKRFDRTTAPWLNPVLESFTSNDNKVIICRGPVGSSKTTLFEALHQYIPAQDPGPMMTITQSDDDTAQWVETRLIKCLEACEPLRHLWPREKVREKIKKDRHLWPHMFSLFGGASMNNLQSNSIRFGLGDEAWLWKPGMVREFEGRFHDRWNRRLLLVSQGAKVGSEFSNKYALTDRRVRSFKCPKCDQVQPIELPQLKWDTFYLNDNPLDGYDFRRIFPTIRYECCNSKCDHRWLDKPQERRNLSSLGYYIPTNRDAVDGHVGFHWNVLSVYWISWATLVHEWLIAIEAKKKGNPELFWKFKQKRLAEDEEEVEEKSYGDLLLSDYEIEQYQNGEKIDNEAIRFLTNDKQLDHYWSVVRAWRADGSSRLLYEGRSLTKADIRALQERYMVAPVRVCVDAQYDTPSVYSMCAEEGWTAIHGSKEAGFTHYRGKGKHKKKELSYVSKVEFANLGRDKFGRVRSCRYMFFAASRIKDILVNLRTNRGAPWELPIRVSKEYAKQIDSEVKRRFVDSKTKQDKYDYVKLWDNHLWDCEVHQVVMAYAVGLLSGAVLSVDLEESDSED